jgi:ribonucleoside-triphosphate reductase (thioredoxin)
MAIIIEGIDMAEENKNFNMGVDTKAMMSSAKFFEGYSRWDDTLDRYETWEEAVSRVMDMHREYYKEKMTDELSNLIDEAEELYKQQYVLGAQRALQFGGDQLIRHQMRLYNCTSTYADRNEFFGEFFYILLCGAGAGVSVQKHHIKKLSRIQNRTKQAKIYEIDDSIEGWASAADVLMSSYFLGGGKHPEYEGRRVYFDTTKIRPRGSMISGGFKAPGPEPLRKALDKIEYLLQGLILSGVSELQPIHVYDICMHLADAVLAGGVRRSATIFLFSPDDEEMMTAKTGDWYVKNPQRARSNNSAVIVRKTADRKQFAKLMQSVKEFGEPGFVFVESTEHATNPCVEIGMFPQHEGTTGWQGCNLCEINGAKAVSVNEFVKACRAAAIIGTLQAGYTNFKFVSETTRKIFEREALLGVSITGWMNNPDVLLDKDILVKGANYVKEINKKVAKLIGINPAARTTCVKPAGNASVLLQTASGVHGEHSPIYIRNIQMNKETEVAQLIKKYNPYMVEESVWSANNSDYIISFPVISPENSIYRKDLYGVNLLEKVKLIQSSWVEAGTDMALCVDNTVRHNVSNTISVLPEQWDEIEDYVFENRHSFAGISFLSATGDKDFNQAPNTEILNHQQIIDTYGHGALFASGLIVDATNGFNNLWDAIYTAKQDEDWGDKEKVDIRAEWIRRFRKYADKYFLGSPQERMDAADHCLKAVHLLHRWIKIQQNFVEIDFAKNLESKKYVEIDTTGAAACIGVTGCAI